MVAPGRSLRNSPGPEVISRNRSPTRLSYRITARVEEYMTSNAITAFEDWDVRVAAQRMAEGGFRHLIVLDSGGQVEGVLSIRDLMKGLLRETEEPVLS